MPLRLRSAGGGSVQLNPPVATSTDIVMEVPAHDGAKLITNKSSGTILQVVNFYSTTPTSQSIPNTTVHQDIADIRVTITPTFITSKFYIHVRWFGEYQDQTPAWDSVWGLKRNGTPIGLPPANGSSALGIHMAATNYYANDGNSTPETTFFDYYDAPNTLAPITYQLSLASSISHTLYTNRTVAATTTSNYERGTSSITVMEIAG